MLVCHKFCQKVILGYFHLASSGSSKAHKANFYLLNKRVFSGLATFGLHSNVKIIVLDPMLIVCQIWKVKLGLSNQISLADNTIG